MVSSLVGGVLRGFQFLWTLLTLALAANTVDRTINGSPAIVNYDLFVSIISMLSLFWLIPATIKDFGSIPILTIALDGLNTLFYFCGAVATAAYLGATTCNHQEYRATNFILNGDGGSMLRCNSMKAVTTFMFFNFFLFAATTVFSALNGNGSGMNLRGGMGGIRKGGPAMSQV